MKTQPSKYDDDDGRVICNMDVAGMHWHDRRNPPAAGVVYPSEAITRSEARLYTWYAMLAGLSVALVFSVVLVLFTLFCTQIWLG